MEFHIIDGKKIGVEIREEVKNEVEKRRAEGRFVTLAVVIVGEDSASKVYVKNKKKACEEAGIISQSYEMPKDTTQEQLLELIDSLNQSENVNGILVQLPLPGHIEEEAVLQRISHKKDVDGFHPVSVGALHTGGESFYPCTPAGIIELLKRSGQRIEGKHCVVIGRSNIVGKPVAMLLLKENATVTICHSKTENLKEICRGADIIVAATGKRNTVTEDMIKDGAVIIDVGMNRDENGKLCGDVDFEGCRKKAAAMTPVPGGVGPMTIAMLLKNCLKAEENQRKEKK